MIRRPPRSPLFPSPTLSRSRGRIPLDHCDLRARVVRRCAGGVDDHEDDEGDKDVHRRTRRDDGDALPGALPDRKSTRLNSSHLVISYAVFCLKKKKNRSADFAWLFGSYGNIWIDPRRASCRAQRIQEGRCETLCAYTYIVGCLPSLYCHKPTL